MSLKTGIIGLPNVGKSTLFNALMKAQVEAANYPFATIKPNTGVVNVPDERLDKLTAIFNPKKQVNTAIEFIDIAGLVKGASKGEGLGNQFLANIRECDALVEVVRAFENPEIIHVENSVDPLRDIEIINLELIMADLETLQKRLGRVEGKAISSGDKSSYSEYQLLVYLKANLEQGIPARLLPLNEEQKTFLNLNYHLLTLKPLIYLANVKEDAYANLKADPYYQIVEEKARLEKTQVVAISAEIEAQISQLKLEEQDEFLATLGTAKTGLTKLITTTYELLNLKTFFTVGKDECRAWTFIDGMKAPECAGIIHSDFQRGFIKAEVYHYNDIIKYKTESRVKENGLLRLEGKEYLVKDGDIIFFKFNV